MYQHIAVNGRQVHYRVKGEGVCIVLIHGFLESLEIWQDFFRSSKLPFQMLALDLPGHGRSENHAEVHTMEMMADIVQATMLAQGITRAIVVGHSMGGYVGLALAARHPDFVQGLVLLHSHAAADSDEARLNRDRAIAAIRADHASFIHDFIPVLFAASNRERLSAEIRALTNRAAGTSRKAIIAALEGMKVRADMRPFLANNPLPMLFIAGREDERIPYDMVAEQAMQAFSGELLALKDTGHMGFLECPWLVMTAIEGFVQRFGASTRINGSP